MFDSVLLFETKQRREWQVKQCRKRTNTTIYTANISLRQHHHNLFTWQIYTQPKTLYALHALNITAATTPSLLGVTKKRSLVFDRSMPNPAFTIHA